MSVTGSLEARRMKAAIANADRQRRSPDQGISILGRILELAASIVAFSCIVTASALGLSWNDYSAFRFVLIATAITAAYALLMLILETIQLISGHKIKTFVWRVEIAVLDWMMALLVLSAGAAGAGVTSLNSHGYTPVFTPCHGVNVNHHFCSRTIAGTSFAFITFGAFIPHLFLSTVSAAIEYYQGMGFY